MTAASARGDLSVSGRQFAKRVWHSPTAMSWASVGARSMRIMVVLPLLLHRFTAAEVAVWFLLGSIASFQTLADLGFAPTFARVIAYAMGGATDLRDFRAPQARGSGVPDWPTVQRIWGTMRLVYVRLTLLSVAVTLPLGSVALIRPMRSLASPAQGWIAWGVVAAASVVVFRGNVYSAYLQGMNQIALLRRWDAFSYLGALVTSATVLLAGGRLLALVTAVQVWAVVNVVRNRQLCRWIDRGRFRSFDHAPSDQEVLAAVWPSAWRSGVGVGMGRGVTYASGPILAQAADAKTVAAYLLALRLIQLVSDLSKAPFYSKLPVLARLRSEGRVGEQLQLAKRGMRLGYWTFALGFWAVGVTAWWGLRLIHSHAQFVGPWLWAVLGLAYFIERYGAMHIQLYSTTNHIIWHVANGVAGTIFLVVALATLHSLGIWAFPVAFLAENAGFYAWYSASHVYRTFAIGLKFERSTLLPAFVAVLLYFPFLAVAGPWIAARVP